MLYRPLTPDPSPRRRGEGSFPAQFGYYVGFLSLRVSGQQPSHRPSARFEPRMTCRPAWERRE